MRIDLTRLVKLGLFFCLALTVYKGLMKLPEVQSVFAPARFFNGLENDAENSLIMKERHFDFTYQTGRALEMRLAEMESRGETPPGDVLPSKERVQGAIRKTLAKDERDADYVGFAEEKLARVRRLRAESWTMGWACRSSRGSASPLCAQTSGSARPEQGSAKP